MIRTTYTLLLIALTTLLAACDTPPPNPQLVEDEQEIDDMRDVRYR